MRRQWRKNVMAVDVDVWWQSSLPLALSDNSLAKLSPLYLSTLKAPFTPLFAYVASKLKCQLLAAFCFVCAILNVDGCPVAVAVRSII